MLQKVKSNGLDLDRLMVWGWGCMCVCVCVCENTFKGNNNQRVGSNDELKKQSPEFGLICHVRCA